jgi:RHS repeat-associated protein
MQRTRTYQWDLNDRLRQIADSKQGLTRFGHDVFGNLAWSENPDGSTLFRMPDAVGNLFRTKERTDRNYGPAGQLLRSGSTRYDYDLEGNLISKTEEGGKKWVYEWDGSGMMRKVIRPDGEVVAFTYDALGRRLSKSFKTHVSRWAWDGDTPLHECVEETSFNEKLNPSQVAPITGSETKKELITWLFNAESIAPLAKMTNGIHYGIITDHLGTPLSMHQLLGEEVWSADLNNYGEVFNLHGKAEDCPFRYPGQYEDVETGLYYNRFRYYDVREGIYLSQDPIRLKSGELNSYIYVQNSSTWIDPLGLTCKKIEISRSKYPETAKHIEDAQRAGHPKKLTIDRPGTIARRKEALQGRKKVLGKDLDEYPPAMFKEGGKGASVRAVIPADNRGVGATIGNKTRGLPDGSEVKIVVVD